MNFQLSAKTFFHVLKAASIAAGKKDVRYYLNGVGLHVTGENSVNIVSTDGHRIFKTTIETSVSNYDENAPVFMLPNDKVKLLLEFIKTQTNIKTHIDGLTFELVDQKLSIPEIGIREFNSIDGRFPDYQRAITSRGNYDLPDYKNLTNVCGLNLDYLADAAKIGRELAKLSGQKYNSGAVQFASVATAAQIDFNGFSKPNGFIKHNETGINEVLYQVMPCRM